MRFKLDHTKIIIRRNRRKILKIAFVLATVFFIIFVFSFSLALANRNKFVYGLKIANISIGGVAINETSISAALGEAVKQFFEHEIVLRFDDEEKIWTALPEKLGAVISLDSTIQEVSKIGHQGNFLVKSIQQILALFGRYNISFHCQINENKLESFIREELASIDYSAVNAGWKYDEEIDGFTPIISQEGVIIDRESFKLQLYNNITRLINEDVLLNLVDDYPEVFENETALAGEKARYVLDNAPYKLVVKDLSKTKPVEIPLTKEDMASFIEFKPVIDNDDLKNKILGVTFNREALNSYLVALSPSINRAPVDAQLIVKGDRVTDFSLSQDGLKLEIDNNIIKVREGVLVKNNREIELEVSIISPKIATQDINNMGITSLIGKGISNFAGSPSSRIHNIKIGAARFHGTLIKPGEEFSFNTILGEVGPEQGYEPELVIKRDKTVPEYGGGLCQVSTTAFRAAIYTGLSILERYPHAFPVVYYNPQGFDATIYPPHPDLRFVNDTPARLLIQTKIKGNYLTFEFYGTSDGRRVELEGPYQYDIKDDGSMKTRLFRKIYKNGELVDEKTFHSIYKSPDLYPIQRNPLE